MLILHDGHVTDGEAEILFSSVISIARANLSKRFTRMVFGDQVWAIDRLRVCAWTDLRPAIQTVAWWPTGKQTLSATYWDVGFGWRGTMKHELGSSPSFQKREEWETIKVVKTLVESWLSTERRIYFEKAWQFENSRAEL